MGCGGLELLVALLQHSVRASVVLYAVKDKPFPSFCAQRLNVQRRGGVPGNCKNKASPRSL